MSLCVKTRVFTKKMITTNIDCIADQVDPIEIKIKWHIVADRVSPTYHQVVMALPLALNLSLMVLFLHLWLMDLGYQCEGEKIPRMTSHSIFIVTDNWNEAFKFHFM